MRRVLDFVFLIKIIEEYDYLCNAVPAIMWHSRFEWKHGEDGKKNTGKSSKSSGVKITLLCWLLLA